MVRLLGSMRFLGTIAYHDDQAMISIPNQYIDQWLFLLQKHIARRIASINSLLCIRTSIQFSRQMPNSFVPNQLILLILYGFNLVKLWIIQQQNIKQICGPTLIDILIRCNNNQILMFESQRQIYEYQLCLLSVKMKVKFPCRMKIEHMGSLVTGESPPSEDNRFIFNQELILKDETQSDCFELTVNLLTDKGAKYIAAIIKLYKAELVRSQGERLVLSLSKCIDSEAFCEVKVDQVTAIKTGKTIAPYDRKSTLQREMPYRREIQDMELSPYRHNPTKILESKSEYQFPLNNNGFKHDWETKSRSRLLPPQTAYQKSKIASKINYAVQDPVHYGGGMQLGQSGIVSREKVLEAEVYKEGYQKLKQKYKKEAENSKIELNKRLALENTENNLKLEIMRLKLKSDEQEKSLADKQNKIKELQSQISLLQQKEVDNGYLREDISKKEATIKMLEDKIRSLTRNMDDMRELATDRSNEEGSRLRELQMSVQSLKSKLQNKEREYQRDNKAKLEQLHTKEIQLISKRDQLEREKKNVSDLEKALQNKSFQLEKLLQNERNNNKHKVDEYKAKSQKLEKDIIKFDQERKEHSKQMEQLKSSIIKIQYDKKILTQEIQSIRAELNESKNYRQKYNESQRQIKSLNDQKNYLERQLQKAIQSKEYNLTQINRQFQDQVDYYKRINREFDEKNKSLSNRLIEVEGQLELSRGQQDKLRRNLQSVVKEAAQAKEKQKSARKALKAKEQESLSIESEQATLKQKLKSIEQIWKLQVDKVKEETEKIHIQLDNQLDRVEQLTQSNTQLTMELNRLKIKLQYSQQKNEKDSANIKEKQAHIENLIRDYEEQVSTLDQTINNLRLVEKEQSTKIQRYEIQTIKAEERNQKAKKQIKILEERCNNLDNIFKTKTNQNQLLASERETLSKKIVELQNEYNILKTESLNLTNQRNRLQKMNELLQEQIKKIKNDVTSSLAIIADKEKSEQELRNHIKVEKEEYAKLDAKFNTFKKQTERYKDSLSDTIQKTFLALPLLRKEQGRSFEDLLSRKSASQSTFNDLINIIINQSKEIKQVLTKQAEQVKQLQRENQRAREEASLSSNKYQNAQSTLKKQVQELQHEMEQILAEKQAQNANYTNIIAELDERVKSLELIQEELNTQIQELNFTINSLKMDNDAMNDQNTKKINNLKKLNAELEEKVEYQLMTITELDERCSLMEADIDHLQATIDNEAEASHKKDKIIEQLREAKEIQQNSFDQLKRQKKQLTERVAQLELHFNTEKQHKEKLRTLLQQEQSKANELKNFISNLMKQKESAIKSELERSEKLIEIEAAFMEVNKELQLLKEQNERNAKALQQQKEQNKKFTATIKEGENERKEERSKHAKTQEKLREKQKELLNKDDLLKKLEQKNEKAIEKYKAEIKDLQQELQLKNNNSLQVSKDTNQKIISLQSLLQKKSSQIAIFQAKIIEFEQQLFGERQRCITTEEALAKAKGDNQELRSKIAEMDNNYNLIADESKQKEEKLFELSGLIYNLELKIETKEKQRGQYLQNLNQQWINKYDSMCEEYEQRLELVEKQRDYFKGLSDEKDREISKTNHAIKIAQSNEIVLRKTHEQKIKKLEDQKLALFSQKNSEIQRLIEQSKVVNDSLKQRQVELRRLTNELEVARKTITNLDMKSKQYDQKIKGINKVYQTELEQLKKKDASNKLYRETVNTHQWNVERQIKKSLQNFIKNFLEVSDDKNSQKLIELVRGLEKGVMEIMALKPNEVK